MSEKMPISIMLQHYAAIRVRLRVTCSSSNYKLIDKEEKTCEYHLLPLF